MRVRLIVAAVLAVVVVGTASAATAPLNLKRITATRQNDIVRLRIILDRAWKSGELAKGSGTTLVVLYGTDDGDRKVDYTGRITYHDGKLFEKITGNGSHFPEVPVARPSRTEAKFTHPSDVMFPDPENPGTLRLVVILKRPGLPADRLPRKGWWPIPRPE